MHRERGGVNLSVAQGGVCPGRNLLGVLPIARRDTEMLEPRGTRRNNGAMKSLAGLLVTAALAIGIYYLYLKQMPGSDAGTAPTQAISLTGVRSDLLSIAQAERGNIALNSRCASLDEMATAGTMNMARRERDGYTYEVECSGSDFRVVARHAAPPPAGVAIRYPTLAIDSTMEIREIQ